MRGRKELIGLISLLSYRNSEVGMRNAEKNYSITYRVKDCGLSRRLGSGEA